jgi:hypothetical protein
VALVARDRGGAARRPRRRGRLTRATYPRRVSFVTALAAAIGLLIGVPLLIVALSVAGPIGWIVAAVLLPVAVLATILWLGRARPGDGEPPQL